MVNIWLSYQLSAFACLCACLTQDSIIGSKYWRSILHPLRRCKNLVAHINNNFLLVVMIILITRLHILLYIEMWSYLPCLPCCLFVFRFTTKIPCAFLSYPNVPRQFNSVLCDELFIINKEYKLCSSSVRVSHAVFWVLYCKDVIWSQDKLPYLMSQLKNRRHSFTLTRFFFRIRLVKWLSFS
jgi:hypothetical protein